MYTSDGLKPKKPLQLLEQETAMVDDSFVNLSKKRTVKNKEIAKKMETTGDVTDHPAWSTMRVAGLQPSPPSRLVSFRKFYIQYIPLLIALSRITFNCFLHNFYYTIYLLNLKRKQTVRQAIYTEKKY